MAEPEFASPKGGPTVETAATAAAAADVNPPAAVAPSEMRTIKNGQEQILVAPTPTTPNVRFVDPQQGYPGTGAAMTVPSAVPQQQYAVPNVAVATSNEDFSNYNVGAQQPRAVRERGDEVPFRGLMEEQHFKWLLLALLMGRFMLSVWLSHALAGRVSYLSLRLPVAFSVVSVFRWDASYLLVLLFVLQRACFAWSPILQMNAVRFNTKGRRSGSSDELTFSDGIVLYRLTHCPSVYVSILLLPTHTAPSGTLFGVPPHG